MRRLLRVEQDRAHVARLADDGLGAEAARLTSDLVAGVTRLRRRLDFLLQHFYRGDLDTLDPLLLQALRIGLYDLLERGTPPHAAVSQAVEAARRLTHRGGAGLVNGVLRAVVRAREAGVLPEPATGDPAENLAIRHSYPTWLVRRWLARYGAEEAEALLSAGNAMPTFGLRVNARKTTPGELVARLDALGVSSRPSRWLDDWFVVERLQPILQAGLVRNGLVAVQDEAAGLVVRVLDPQPGETILDGAAAPGGKALYTAQRMGDEGRVVAVDLHAPKLGLIRKAADAQAVRIVEPVAADLRTLDPSEVGGPFDRVLLDVPCSGLGVLARRADLRWNRSEENLAELVALQDALLDAAARFVKPGGLLVYATCSVEPDENEARVFSFLARRADFQQEGVGGLVPAEMRTAEGFYAALPHRHGTDGAFAARLRRLA